MARQIFIILAFFLCLNVVIPVVNAVSPFSPSYTSQASTDLTTARIINAVGCVPATLTGTGTGFTSTTLTDTRQNWQVNGWASAKVEMTTGGDKGDTRVILSNTGDILTVSGSWITTPSNGDGYQIIATTGGSDYQCSASVGGGTGKSSILGSVVSTILVFGNFFAAASFLVQIAGGVIVPSYYIFSWMAPACGPQDLVCLGIAFGIAGIYQAMVWFAYADGFFYIISGRDLLG